MEKYLKFDDQVTVLTKHKELQQYLQFRKENDVWVQPYIKETTVVGIEDHPLFLSQYFLSNGIELNDESNECVKDTGMFLTFPMNGERKIYPTRHTAFTSICQRAGLSGPTISNFIGTAFKKVLPVTEKASWLTRGFSLYMQKCKILIRDGKISAMMSNGYSILPADELVGALEKELKKEHKDMKMLSATISHEYLNIEYLLNDKDADSSFSLLLKDFGLDENVKTGIGFATSDVGLSRAYVYPFFMTENGYKTRFGDSAGVEHEGKNSVDTFVQLLPRVDSLFKEAENQIEKLGNTDIDSISSTVRNIVDDNKSLFPKSFAEDVVASLSSQSGTAIDVYLALNEIVENYIASRGNDPTLALTLKDRLSKYLYINIKKYDC